MAQTEAGDTEAVRPKNPIPRLERNYSPSSDQPTIKAGSSDAGQGADTLRRHSIRNAASSDKDREIERLSQENEALVRRNLEITKHGYEHLAEIEKLRKRISVLQEQPRRSVVKRGGKQFDERDLPNLAQNFIITNEFLQVVCEPNLKAAYDTWKDKTRQLQRTQDQLHALQSEVLRSVDRYQPAYDEAIQKDFIQLNNNIGTLAKAPKLEGIVSEDFDFRSSALWPNSVQKSLCLGKLTRLEKRLLFRQALWKFYAETLLRSEQPFATFAGHGALRGSYLDFAKLYPDHETNEKANKWRACTAAQLESTDNDDNKEQRHIALTKDLAAHLYDRLMVDARHPEHVLEVLKDPDVAPKVRIVQAQALALARQLAMQRARFSVVAVDLAEVNYTKDDAPHQWLTCDGSVGVPGEEEDRGGEIMILGSPALCKWGNGAGQNLEEKTVLVKAFVRLSPEEE